LIGKVRIPADDSGGTGILEYIGIQTINTNDEDSSTPSPSIQLQYKADADSSWTTIGTHDPSTSDYTRLSQESTGVNLPDKFKTLQLRLNFTGLSQLVRLEVYWDTTDAEE